jgi:hypothetical protein
MLLVQLLLLEEISSEIDIALLLTLHLLLDHNNKIECSIFSPEPNGVYSTILVPTVKHLPVPCQRLRTRSVIVQLLDLLEVLVTPNTDLASSSLPR